MSVTVQQILGLLQTLAPSELACSWDNVGLLVDVGVPVSHVLTTLDITAAVVQEAVENDCQLIVSHHPVIFDPLKHISAGDVPALLIKNNISAICMHTNLDAAPGGVNDTLADLLGMQREGRRNFAEDCGRPITCLAEVSGAGGSYLQEAIDAGADCLVTGEAAHHIALLAKQKGVGLVVSGHWGTEHGIADVLAAHIASNFPALTVRHAAADRDPYSYLL